MVERGMERGKRGTAGQYWKEKKGREGGREWRRGGGTRDCKNRGRKSGREKDGL